MRVTDVVWLFRVEVFMAVCNMTRGLTFTPDEFCSFCDGHSAVLVAEPYIIGGFAAP